MPKPTKTNVLKGKGAGYLQPFGFIKWDNAIPAVIIKVPAKDYPMLKDKQKNGRRNNPDIKWVILSHKVWYDAGRGLIDSAKEVLVHLDSNPYNNTLDNLYKLPRRLLGPMNWHKRFTTDREITKVNIVLTDFEVELKKKIKALRRRRIKYVNRVGRRIRTDRIGEIKER